MVARQKKSDGSGLGLLLVAVVVLFVAFAVPTLITWLLIRDYRRLEPDSCGRKLCLFSLIAAAILLYAGGTFFIKQSLLDGHTLKDVSTWAPMIFGLCASFPFIGLFMIGKRKASIRRKVAGSYQERLNGAIADGLLDNAEIEELNELILKHSLSGSSLREIHRSACLNALWNASDDLKIDEKEVASLERLMNQLEIKDYLNEYLDEFVHKVNRIHSIVDGNLEGIRPPVGFIPRNSETCFFYENCELYENVASSGAFVGISFKLDGIVPHLNPRVYVGKRIGYDSMKIVDRGTMAITNRRVVFLGAIHNREMVFGKIIGLDIGYDGIQIRRDGKAKLEVFRMNALDKEIAVALIGHIARTKD